MKYNKAFVICDLHTPYQNEDVLTIAKKIIKDEKPTHLILLGDMFDCEHISKFTVKGIDSGLVSTLSEIEQFKKILKELLKVCPRNVETHYLLGNHECYLPHTEALTAKGWIKISELKGDEFIATFDDKHIGFHKPTNYIKTHKEEAVLIEGTYHKQIVSAGHRVYKNDMTTTEAKDMQNGDEQDLPHNRIYNRPKHDISNDIIKVLTWAAMDGTIVYDDKYNPGSKKIRIQFKLSKQDKIDKLKSVLEKAGIKYTFKPCKKSGCNILQPYYIRIYGDDARMIASYFNRDKDLPVDFLKLNREQVDVILESLLDTDGSLKDGGIAWTSVNKKNIDLIQTLCVLSGYNFKYSIIKNGSGFKNGKIQYHAKIRKNLPKLNKYKVSKQTYSGDMYCVEMPLGTLVTRVDGKVALSGNCRIKDTLERFKVKGLMEKYHYWSKQLNLQEHFPMCKFYGYNDIYSLGKLSYTHGIYHNEFHTKKHAISLTDNIIYGHLHTHQVYTMPTANKKYPRQAISMGCACKLNMSYLRGKPSPWLNQLGIVNYRKKGEYTLDTPIIINGKTFYNNKLYTA